jgi:hypothetical protein
MVYALHKFRHYLLGSHFKMYTNHFALRYLVNKPMLGGEYEYGYYFFQEYDFEVIMKPRKFNSGHDHLSHILSREDVGNLDDSLPYAHLFTIQTVDDYFVDMVQFLSTGVTPP